MTGIIISALSIFAAAYLILKKYYAPGALLVVGIVTLAVSACLSPDPLITGKKATHFLGFDVIQMMTNILQSRAAGLGMNIMAIAGFSAYMDQIGASKALLRISLKPLTFVHSPYIVMTLGLALSLVLNIFIPSAAGLALLLMVSLYPILVAAGISRQSAGATILISGCLCLGPSGPNNLLAADLIVFATPIYSWYCTPPMKALMDRMVYGMNKYYGAEKGPALWAGKSVALLTTCGYRPEKGVDLFEEGLRRYCKHSALRYLGRHAERHLGYGTVFMDGEKEARARAFARELLKEVNT